MSKFAFVKDKILQKNLDIVLNYILELTVVADNYKDILQCSFRKTIVIYTTSIIEALLLWALKRETNNQEEVEVKDWKYFDVRVIHKFDKTPFKQIIWCYRKKDMKKFNNLDLFNINRLCLQYKIINKRLFNKIDKARLMRNKLHIGSLTKIEDEYSKKDLIFISEVMEQVVRAVKSI